MPALPHKDLTTGQIAQRLSVAPRTVAQWIDTGRLTGYHLPGSHHRRVRPDDLLQFARTHDLPREMLADLTTH